MNIDVHAHYYPPEYFACLSKMTGTELEPVGGFSPASPSDRAESVAAAGLDLQILSLGNPVKYLPRVPDAATAARVGNDAMAEAVQHGGGRSAPRRCAVT